MRLTHLAAAEAPREQTVARAVTTRIVNGGGDNSRLPSLMAESLEWQREGPALGYSDMDLLSWFFARIARFLELRRPAEQAADLVRWVIKAGTSLRDFTFEFSAAATAVLSADATQDRLILTSLLEILRQQFPMASQAWQAFDVTAKDSSTRALITILRAQQEVAEYEAKARGDGRPVYPTHLSCYSKRPGATYGGGMPPKAQFQQPQSLKPVPTDAEKAERRRIAQDQAREARINYFVYMINTFGTGAPATRSCFNCGSSQHVFARCDQPFNEASWAAACAKLPWVLKFKPANEEDFKQLCAKAIERAAGGARGRSAQRVYEQRHGDGVRGGGRGGGRHN